MSPGQQFIARVGFETLSAGQIYHVVAHDSEHSRVILASFGEKPNNYSLHCLRAPQFLAALEGKVVRECEHDEIRRLPPWLSNREDDCLNFSEALFDSDGSAKCQYDRVESRLKKVRLADDLAEQLFSRPDFERALNRLARRLKTNESRYRAWVITYMAFGRNRWALLAPTKGRGAYDRVAKKTRNSPRGYPVDDDVKKKIIKGFKTYAKKGVFLKSVWADAAAYTFGCKYRENERNETSLFHPSGHPFPTYGQFRYWVVQLLGHATVWTKLLGEQGYRTKFPAPIGKYSEGQQDLMEMVYSDATTSAVHPRSPLDDEPLEPIKTVKCICATSGMIAGIAFGIGSERESLYRQAIASMMMPKSIYGKVFGIEINDDEWPVAHLSRSFTTDQGPGSTKQVRKSLSGEDYQSSPNMTPAYTPQSNSPVESTHNSTPGTSGAPFYAVSNKTPFELAADMVREAMAKNRSKGATARATPKQVGHEIITPIQLWKDYASRGRQAGIKKHIADIVAGYLPKVHFEVCAGHLTRCGIIYRPTDGKQRKFLQEIYRYEGAELEGWAFDISNRIEWVRLHDEIVMVSPVANVRARDSETILSAPDLLRYKEMITSAETKSASLRDAEAVRLRIDSVEQTGKKYASVTQKKGRAKVRTPQNKRQAAALNNQ